MKTLAQGFQIFRAIGCSHLVDLPHLYNIWLICHNNITSGWFATITQHKDRDITTCARCKGEQVSLCKAHTPFLVALKLTTKLCNILQNWIKVFAKLDHLKLSQNKVFLSRWHRDTDIGQVMLSIMSCLIPSSSISTGSLSLLQQDSVKLSCFTRQQSLLHSVSQD